MNNSDTQKTLTGPFQSESDPGTYFVYDKDGKQITLSPDLLFAGTATEVMLADVDVGAFIEEKPGIVNFGAPAQTKLDL